MSEQCCKRRSAIIEHPFGTLKCRAGYQHFLVRGFDKVRGEWSLMALCYNFTRVLNILGFDRLTAYLVQKTQRLSKGSCTALLLSLRSIPPLLQRFDLLAAWGLGAEPRHTAKAP